jgi:hypothetical protein
VASWVVEDVIAAFHAAYISPTYYDTAARVMGSDSAVKNVATDESPTKMVYGEFAGGMAGVKWALMGSSGAATPHFATPDTFATGVLFGGLYRGAGAFVDWDDTPPFTGALGPGMYRGTIPAPLGSISVQAYEAEENIIGVVRAFTSDIVYGLWMGAALDAETTLAVDGETGVGGNGALLAAGNFHPTGLVTNWASGTDGNRHLEDASSANNSRFRIFDPGLGTVVPGYRDNYCLNQATTIRTKRSGALVAEPIFAQEAVTGSRWRGRLREIFYCRDIANNSLLQVGGVDVGYFIGSKQASDAAAMLLRY